jgi:hypothetical protein
VHTLLERPWIRRLTYLTDTGHGSSELPTGCSARAPANRALYNRSTANSNRLCRLSSPGWVFSLFTLFETPRLSLSNFDSMRLVHRGEFHSRFILELHFRRRSIVESYREHDNSFS